MHAVDGLLLPPNCCLHCRHVRVGDARAWPMGGRLLLPSFVGAL